jgi:hypothetical protein
MPSTACCVFKNKKAWMADVLPWQPAMPSYVGAAPSLGEGALLRVIWIEVAQRQHTS